MWYFCQFFFAEPDKFSVFVGIAIGANSRGAVMSGTRKALKSGTSKEESTRAVLLSLTTTGFPNMIAALQWVDAVLEEA